MAWIKAKNCIMDWVRACLTIFQDDLNTVKVFSV